VDRGPKETCWRWLGAKTKDGYGVIRIGQTVRRAHRVIWELQNGPVPPGLDLDHLCGEKACVNPDHLEPVTRSRNVSRQRLRGTR
jgi:hypothetical protein